MKRPLLTYLLAGAVLAAPLPMPSFAQPEPEQRVAVAELSPEAERAIDRGLRYLINNQNADGSFGHRYHTACTALALMAFMVKGEFPDRGDHGEQLAKAVDYLVEKGKRQRGFLGGEGNPGMYEHGLATLALSEVWGESEREDLRETLKAAVDVIFRAQHRDGGWRYDPRPRDHDISVTVMQIVALASAKEAGILVPDEVINRALSYVRSCQHPFQGGFRYQPHRGEPEFARSAAGVMSLMMMGQHGTPEAERGMDYLLQYDDSKFEKVGYYYYAHYYAIQCVYQAGDAYYQPWYPKIRDALLRRQERQGNWGGGSSGAPDEYSTAMAILVLGVPYRYLPIYQR
jgi:hypothetical protein